MLRRILTPRWSTATLLAVVAAGACVGYRAGQRGASVDGEALTRAGAGRPVAAPAPSRSGAASLPPGLRECEAVLARPDCDERNAELERLITALGARDHVSALGLAQAQPNRLLQRELVLAALRGWARLDSDGAARWVSGRPLAERSLAMNAVLAGAVARDAAGAVELTRRVMREDPDLAHDYGCGLIFALARTGAFAVAARFAAEDTPQRAEWLDTAYAAWAEHQPADAARSAEALGEGPARSAAIRAVALRWSAVDPVGLARFAVSVADDSDRRVALKVALEEWATTDLPGLSRWLNSEPANRDLDPGVAAIAQRPPLATLRPEVALGWAESICDAELRASTLSAVVATWAQQSPVEARRYAQSSPQLSPTDREAVLAALEVANR